MEESHAKLRDRPCLEDRPSATWGLYLQGSACCSEARVLFKCFPFGECRNPATLVVWRFQKDRRNPLIPYIPKKIAGALETACFVFNTDHVLHT